MIFLFSVHHGLGNFVEMEVENRILRLSLLFLLDSKNSSLPLLLQRFFSVLTYFFSQFYHLVLYFPRLTSVHDWTASLYSQACSNFFFFILVTRSCRANAMLTEEDEFWHKSSYLYSTLKSLKSPYIQNRSFINQLYCQCLPCPVSSSGLSEWRLSGHLRVQLL